jgi:hypothetical protein
VKFLTLAIASVMAFQFANCAREHQSSQRGATPNKTAVGVQTSGRVQSDSSKSSEDDTSPRRLESVTWNSVKHQLAWDVSKGAEQGTAYHALGTDHYIIDMDRATMTYNGQTRRFSEDEASNVRKLMDVISKYAVESTVWWESGEGEPLDSNGSPVGPAKPKQEKQEKLKPGKVPTNQIAGLEKALDQFALIMSSTGR